MSVILKVKLKTNKQNIKGRYRFSKAFHTLAFFKHQYFILFLSQLTQSLWWFKYKPHFPIFVLQHILSSTGYPSISKFQIYLSVSISLLQNLCIYIYVCMCMCFMFLCYQKSLQAEFVICLPSSPSEKQKRKQN